MAELIVDDSTVTVALSAVEKIEAVHGNVTFPRASVISARAVPDGMAVVPGTRVGTGLPGVILVGTVRGGGTTTFAVCHGRQPAVVLELADQPYDRIVVTVDDPATVLRSLA